MGARYFFCVATIAAFIAFSGVTTAQPSALRIVVIAGEDAINVVQQKTAVAPVIEVRDRNDQPVAGAVVTFAVRSGRATLSGSRTLTVTTNATGRAVASGLMPTGAGAVKISAAAAFQGQSVAVTIVQTNVMTAAQAAAISSAGASGAGAGGAGTAGTRGPARRAAPQDSRRPRRLGSSAAPWPAARWRSTVCSAVPPERTTADLRWSVGRDGTATLLRVHGEHVRHPHDPDRGDQRQCRQGQRAYRPRRGDPLQRHVSACRSCAGATETFDVDALTGTQDNVRFQFHNDYMFVSPDGSGNKTAAPRIGRSSVPSTDADRGRADRRRNKPDDQRAVSAIAAWVFPVTLR